MAKPKPGDICEKCGKGRYKTYKTVKLESVQQRHFHCRKCGYLPKDNKVNVPLRFTYFAYRHVCQYMAMELG